MTKLACKAISNLSVFVGGLAFLLFFIFVIFGPLNIIDLRLENVEIVYLNSALSLIYFFQHSLMVRESIRNRITKIIPEKTFYAFYSIVSGITLISVMLLWQESSYIIMSVSGEYIYLLRILLIVSVFGLMWGIKSLSEFDPFGRNQIEEYMNNKEEKEMKFVSQGAFKIVRHPFYLFILIMIWSYPTLSIDRLLFVVLWSIWIFVGTILEERDLVNQIGNDYREYKRKVPMLIPYKVFRRCFGLKCTVACCKG